MRSVLNLVLGILNLLTVRKSHQYELFVLPIPPCELKLKKDSVFMILHANIQEIDKQLKDNYLDKTL